MNLDPTKIDNVEFSGIDHKDSPDYSDVEVVSADYDGKEMTEEQLELLRDDSSLVHDLLYKYLY